VLVAELPELFGHFAVRLPRYATSTIALQTTDAIIADTTSTPRLPGIPAYRPACIQAKHAQGQRIHEPHQRVRAIDAVDRGLEYVGNACIRSAASQLCGGHSVRTEGAAMVAGLFGVVLLLFEIVLIARMVVDWVGVLSPVGGRTGLYQARRITHGITEPVIGPVRRVLKPVRLGSVSVDLAFTAVFIAVVVLRTVVVPLIPF
jgi:YggT family protein